VSTLNLGILAHVDAGKTSLTERLLFAAGVIDEIGSVDDGSTQTDSLALERQRGITIKSAVASFAVGDVTVNLIDTPGHPDFIAEVERVLSVLDGAVLVISAVEGVQAQTRVLMRTLQRLRIPVLMFVNKIDRAGADDDRVLHAISAKLTPAIVSMGSARGLGTRGAMVIPFGAGDAGFTATLAEALADHDDALLAAYVRDESAVPYGRLRAGLAAQAARGLVYPVFSGSAMTGAGVPALTAGITELLPAAGGDTDGPVSGTVFKVERGAAGEKIAYVRMFSGTVRARDRLVFGHSGEGRLTAVSVAGRGPADRRSPPAPRGSVAAGEIGKLWGLSGIQVGDSLGEPPPTSARRYFPPPTLETVVTASRPADRGALRVALGQLAEQDPLINLRQDDARHETYVSLYGEVQKEVIQATLANDYGIGVEFRETTTICIERIIGSGTAAETINKPPNPFLATIGLRIEPAALDSGVQFRLEIELGSLPPSFLKAIESAARAALGQGIYGWQVTDAAITLTQSGYWARQSHAHGSFDSSMSSTAGDFRNLTPLVLMTALQQAGTQVLEPMHRFHLEVPADTLGAILPVLAGLRAVPRTPAMQDSQCLLTGEIPAARVHELQQQLPALTRGEGVLEAAFDRYQPVRGPLPTRPRSDHNPLNREEYLRRVVPGPAGRRDG
jgi:ribosomal protection tetracycline resistance protein